MILNWRDLEWRKIRYKKKQRWLQRLPLQNAVNFIRWGKSIPASRLLRKRWRYLKAFLRSAWMAYRRLECVWQMKRHRSCLARLIFLTAKGLTWRLYPMCLRSETTGMHRNWLRSWSMHIRKRKSWERSQREYRRKFSSLSPRRNRPTS